MPIAFSDATAGLARVRGLLEHEGPTEYHFYVAASAHDLAKRTRTPEPSQSSTTIQSKVPAIPNNMASQNTYRIYLFGHLHAV